MIYWTAYEFNIINVRENRRGNQECTRATLDTQDKWRRQITQETKKMNKQRPHHLTNTIIVLFLYLEFHILTILAIPCRSFWFTCSQKLLIIWISNLFDWEYLMYVIPEKNRVVCNKLMSTFHFLYIKDVESRINSQCTWVCELVHTSNFYKIQSLMYSDLIENRNQQTSFSFK